MSGVDLDDVKQWLTTNQTTMKLKASAHVAGVEKELWTTTRRVGPSTKSAEVSGESKTTTRADGTKVSTPFLVEREDVAKLAAGLEISDGVEQVLGTEWKAEFPKEAAALGHELEHVIQHRPGSRTERPGHERSGEEREGDGDGQ